MSLKRNATANFVSQAWSVLMGLAFIPLYIQYLGLEAFGLIGFFASLQAWLAIVDLGLSLTVNREMARFGAGADSDDAGPLHQLLRAVRAVYLGVGLALVALVWWLAPLIATQWFQASQLTPEVLQTALRLLGVALVLRWVSQIHRSAIQGLQRQVWLGGFTVVSSTLRPLGALLLLAFAEVGVVGFFAWQVLVSALELAVLVLRLKCFLPPEQTPMPLSLAPLRRVWRFAAGVFMADAFAIVMTQSDKLILSNLLSLHDFGVYSFAFTLGTALAAFKTPLFHAVSPRLTAQAAAGDAAGLQATYHKASQAMSVLAIPGALVATVYADRLIYAWSGSLLLAEQAAAIAAVFILAYMLNSLIHIPAALALSHGWSAWGMTVNGLAAFAIVPAVFFGAKLFGPIGAAAANLALNLLYFLFAVYWLHRRLLRTEWARWLAVDNLAPLAVAAVLVAAIRFWVPAAGERWPTAFTLAAVWLLVSAAVAMSLPYPRQALLTLLPGMFRVLRRPAR